MLMVRFEVSGVCKSRSNTTSLKRLICLLSIGGTLPPVLPQLGMLPKARSALLRDDPNGTSAGVGLTEGGRSPTGGSPPPAARISSP